MTHDEIVTEVQARAKRRGVLTHYCHRAQFCHGDRGLPDVIAVGKFRAAFLEIKTPYDQLDPPQTTWRHALKGAGQEHHVIRPGHLDDGTLDAILDGLAYGQPVLFGAA